MFFEIQTQTDITIDINKKSSSCHNVSYLYSLLEVVLLSKNSAVFNVVKLANDYNVEKDLYVIWSQPGEGVLSNDLKWVYPLAIFQDKDVAEKALEEMQKQKNCDGFSFLDENGKMGYAPNKSAFNDIVLSQCEITSTDQTPQTKITFELRKIFLEKQMLKKAIGEEQQDEPLARQKRKI